MARGGQHFVLGKYHIYTPVNTEGIDKHTACAYFIT